MLILNLYTNFLGGCALQLDQSIPRQLTRGAPSLDIGYLEAVDLGTNLITVDKSTQEEVKIEARHRTYNQQEKRHRHPLVF